MTLEIIENFHTADFEEEPETFTEVTTEVADDLTPFQTILDRVLVKRVIETKTTAGRFIIPDKYQQQSHKGVVISIGELVTQLQIGDIVLFGEYNPEKISLDGEELLVVSIHDIRGFQRKKIEVAA